MPIDIRKICVGLLLALIAVSCASAPERESNNRKFVTIGSAIQLDYVSAYKLQCLENNGRIKILYKDGNYKISDLRLNGQRLKLSEKTTVTIDGFLDNVRTINRVDGECLDELTPLKIEGVTYLNTEFDGPIAIQIEANSKLRGVTEQILYLIYEKNAVSIFDVACVFNSGTGYRERKDPMCLSLMETHTVSRKPSRK